MAPSDDMWLYYPISKNCACSAGVQLHPIEVKVLKLMGARPLCFRWKIKGERSGEYIFLFTVFDGNRRKRTASFTRKRRQSSSSVFIGNGPDAKQYFRWKNTLSAEGFISCGQLYNVNRITPKRLIFQCVKNIFIDQKLNGFYLIKGE